MKRMLSVLVVFAAVTFSGAEDGFKDAAGSHLDILHGGKPLVRYMYRYDPSTPESRHDTYKVFHHVMDEDGEQEITKGPGGKFTHHRGIFIGWSRLGHGGKRYDLWHMRGKAAQVHREFLKQEAGEKASVLSTRINWLTDGETVAIDEARTVTVQHTDDDAHLLLDFETQLKAANADVDLNGDPEHAGFQYRPHNDVVGNKSAKYTFHKDGLNLKKDKSLPWVAETYELREKVYTVQYMYHPDNPEDAVYSAYRDYGRFGSFFQRVIPDGETLNLKYRIRITPGPAPSREALQAQYDAYCQ